LNDQGASAKARQVLTVARTCQPGDAAVWDLTVKLAPSLEAREQAYGVMVERFPDQPKYAVQLGAARAKLGDHAGARRVLEPLTRAGKEAIKAEALLELARSELAQGRPGPALANLPLA